MAAGSPKTGRLEKIIEAATKEFAEKGYEKASTAQICKSAGVSKGLLFHHFETKKGLYLQLFERIMADFVKELDKITFDDCKTYLDTIIKTSNVKMNYFIKHPGVYEIALETTYYPPDELKTDIKEIFNKYIKMEDYFSERVFEKYEFRKEIDPNKAWEIVRAVTALVERKIMERFEINKGSGKPFIDDIRTYSKELFEYYDIIFNGIIVSESKTVKWRRASGYDNDGKVGYKAI